MKQAVRLSCAVLFVFLLGASVNTQAQTNPDSFVAQITSSARDSYAGDISGDGRFVVIESTGDIATDRTTRNNADGNREIFLFDYAQRRIFQITNTTSARVNTANPAVNATNPFTDFSNVRVEVSNNHPVISNNGRWIAFSSNADTPANFDGDANSASLIADGNQEIFIYFIPAAPAVSLTNGGDIATVDLTAGTFTRVTNTAASRLPIAGATDRVPFVAFDNRDASVNDNASFTAFVSTRNLVGTGNQDGNPEIFIFNRTSGATAQLTATVSPSATVPLFNENPSLSGPGTAVAFVSNANIAAGGSSNNSDLNAEVYLGSYDGTTATVTRQVTRTTTPAVGFPVNLFSPGRRISRDGNFIAMESLADLSGDNSVKTTITVFIYDVAANSFKQIGPRAQSTNAQRFPTFTDYDVSLRPATVVFTSGLNFRADGTIPTTASEGLNPSGATQIFAAPVSGTTTFTRLSNTPGGPVAVIQPFTSNTRERIAFTVLGGVEFGGGNTDGRPETIYHLSKQGTDAAGATLSFFTGASDRPVTGANPTAPAVAGLAPGMLAIIRSATPLAPSSLLACPGVIPGPCASEVNRRPSLPIELNGVSVSINSAAAGLYSVAPGQINFVVPPGLTPNTGTATYPVVINNNGTTIRSTITILAAQPDIFTSTNGAGGRAVVFNVTNPATEIVEPFTVTTGTDPTKLRIVLTGVRGVTQAQITVRIGTTDLTGTAILTAALPRGVDQVPGYYQIDVQLPASLAGAGDVPVIVTVTIGNQTFTSRPADTAPRIQIN